VLAAGAEFTEPRLVAAYDTLNPYAPDAQPGFYAGLAAELGAASILDLGCGTGLMTCALARRGHRMIGVEPAPGLLAQARRRPDGDRVRWIHGDAERIGTPGVDLAIMTGQVAQFFLTDADWLVALVALRAGLRPGGWLAFESRNPEAREWERWTGAHRTRVDDPDVGPIEFWLQTHGERAGIVSYAVHYVFTDGEELVAPGRLRFRSAAELGRSLVEAGFRVDRLYGDWDRRPAGPQARELIVVAASASTAKRRPSRSGRNRTVVEFDGSAGWLVAGWARESQPAVSRCHDGSSSGWRGVACGGGRMGARIGSSVRRRMLGRRLRLLREEAGLT
jgi:SAM-dependent methyltransferase